MIFCTNCGAQNEPGTQFCTKCGTPLGQSSGTGVPQAPVSGAPPAFPQQPPTHAQPPQGFPQQPYVPAPQSELPPGQPFPGGYVATQDPTAKSKLVAGLLGIFLGWLGIHRFYLGYQTIAIAQLAVGVVGLLLSPFTCGLILLGAWVWGLVDGIMILTGSLRTDGTGKPLRE